MGDNYFGITDKGRQRDNNEDIFIAKNVFNKRSVLACVIDGVGGYDGGEIAARLTKEAIIQQLSKVPENNTSAMVAALESANKKIFKEKQANRQYDKMACVVTLAIADLQQNKFCYAHVGDTRLYLFRDSSLVKITNDHSTVGFLEESGRLTETAAMQHPKRNEVNKALGYEASISLAKDFIDTGESPFLPGDMILLCSDGLTDMISSATIIDILNKKTDLKTSATKLVEAANHAGGKDNISVVLVKNDKPPAKLAATKPAVTRANNNGDTHSLDAGENLVQESQVPGISGEKNRKGGRGLLILLITLCVIFLAGFAWFFAESRKKNREPKLLMPPPKKEQNDGERRLKDSIRAAVSKSVSLPIGQSYLIADSIVINSDSLHVRGNGATLRADSSYKGAAFVLSTNCTYLLLDSLVLAGFNIGVLVRSKGLHLKNVRFTNCVVPVQLEHHFPQDTLITGTQAETLFHHQDSLHK